MKPKATKKAYPSARKATATGVGEARAGYVAVPEAKYRALLARLEDLEDARLLRAAEAKSTTRVYLPLDLVKRMNAGEHPVRVWRAFRGLTLSALAVKAKLPAGYLSEIETGKKPGSTRAFKALAAALGATVDDLLP